MELDNLDILEAKEYLKSIDELTELICSLEKQICLYEKDLNKRISELKVPISGTYKMILLKLARLDEESRRTMDDYNCLKSEKEINTLRLNKMKEKLMLKKKEMGIIPR